MLDGLFINCGTKAGFNAALGTSITNENIVFIQETHEIWTHGTFYNCKSYSEEEIIAIINENIDKIDLDEATVRAFVRNWALNADDSVIPINKLVITGHLSDGNFLDNESNIIEPSINNFYLDTTTNKVYKWNNTTLNYELLNDVDLSDYITSDQISNTYQTKLNTQSAYIAKGNSTKVPQITTNNLGQVTSISEVNIAIPTISNDIIADSSSNTTTTSPKSVVDYIDSLDLVSLENNTIPSQYLPSYVDDVIEAYYNSTDNKFYATYIPEDDSDPDGIIVESWDDEIEPESGKIYVDLLTNKTYRWGGSTYVEISESLAIGTTTGTAFDGGTGYSHVTNDDIHVTINDKQLWNSKGTITGITMNGSSKGTSGIVDLGTVITDVSDKANQSEMSVVDGTGVDSDKTTITLKNGTSATVLKSHQDVSNFITKSVDDLVNYYLKSETYTKIEVQTLINTVKQFTYEVVQTLPTATADTMHKIYLVPSADPQTQNVKDEYITIDNGTEAQTRYTWEQIGSTAIDLSGYVTTSDLNNYLLLTGGTLTGNLVIDKGNVANPATIKVYGCQVLDENDSYYGVKEYITIGPDYIRFIDGLSAGDNTLSYVGGVLNYNGIISADGFSKTGGTSSQFLKADGSVDNNTYIKTSDITNSVINITDNTTSICNITGVNNSGKNETIIYTNMTSGYDLILTIPSNNYVTPTGYDIELTVPYGGYCEVNYLNIGGTIYARGI